MHSVCSTFLVRNVQSHKQVRHNDNLSGNNYIISVSRHVCERHDFDYDLICKCNKTRMQYGFTALSRVLKVWTSPSTSPLCRLYFHFLWDHRAHCCSFENGVYAHVCARGRKQCCKLHYCLWRVSLKLSLPFCICNVFFVSKNII